MEDEEDEFEGEFPLSSTLKLEKCDDTDDEAEMIDSINTNININKNDNNNNDNDNKNNIDNKNGIVLKTNGSSSSSSKNNIKVEGGRGEEEAHMDFTNSIDVLGEAEGGPLILGTLGVNESSR